MDAHRSARGIASGSAHQKEIAIRIHFKLPTRMPPLWIAGISICLLAALGVVAIVRSIPASYANVPVERALSKHRAVASVPADAYSYSKDSQAELAGAQAAINRQNRALCPECGVIDSVRQIGVTIRFRDGSTMVLNEADPRTWRLGTRVIVIGRSSASND